MFQPVPVIVVALRVEGVYSLVICSYKAKEII